MVVDCVVVEFEDDVGDVVDVVVVVVVYFGVGGGFEIEFVVMWFGFFVGLVWEELIVVWVLECEIGDSV